MSLPMWTPPTLRLCPSCPWSCPWRHELEPFKKTRFFQNQKKTVSAFQVSSFFGRRWQQKSSVLKFVLGGGGCFFKEETTSNWSFHSIFWWWLKFHHQKKIQLGWTKSLWLGGSGPGSWCCDRFLGWFFCGVYHGKIAIQQPCGIIFFGTFFQTFFLKQIQVFGAWDIFVGHFLVHL